MKKDEFAHLNVTVQRAVTAAMFTATKVCGCVFLCPSLVPKISTIENSVSVCVCVFRCVDKYPKANSQLCILFVNYYTTMDVCYTPQLPCTTTTVSPA